MRRAAGLVTLLAVTGCSGSYTPVNSPRISTVVRGGTLSYFKDGKEYPAGLFGGGVIDAVQGNPQAVAEAEKGHDLVVGGFVVSLVGLGAVIGGTAIAVSNDDGQRGLDGAETAAVGLMLGGLGVSIVGAVLTSSAIPHFYDAVAIYNDGVPPVLPAYGAPQPPPGFPPGPPPVFNPQQPPAQSPPVPPAPAPGTQPPGT